MKSDRELILRVWDSMDYLERFDWLISELQPQIENNLVSYTDYDEIIFQTGEHISIADIRHMDVEKAFSIVSQFSGY